MTSLYVDVTQIFTAGRKTQALTGVQRVVLEVAHELCARRMASPVFHDHARRQLYGLPPELLVDGTLHDGEARRRLLGTPCKWRDPANYATAPQRLSRLAASVARGLIHRGITPVGEAAIPIRGPLQHPLICPGAPPVSAQVARHAGAGAVALIHDAIPLRTGEARDSFIGRDYLNAFRRMNALGVRYAANSAFTRDDFLAAARASGLPVPSAPVEVILLAAELRDLPPGTDETAADRLPDGPFFLTVGGLDGRKNGRIILEAMCEIARAHGPASLPTLLAAGHNPETPGSLRHEVATSPAFREVAPRIVWATSTGEARLRAAYRGATAMIYPSRFEGFGLPVGEALWLGTPVLASDAASIPEAGGELAEYFSPDDPQELARLMWRLIDSPDHAASTRKRIAAAKPHLRTWADVAEDFASLARR